LQHVFSEPLPEAGVLFFREPEQVYFGDIPAARFLAADIKRGLMR